MTYENTKFQTIISCRDFFFFKILESTLVQQGAVYDGFIAKTSYSNNKKFMSEKKIIYLNLKASSLQNFKLF